MSGADTDTTNAQHNPPAQRHPGGRPKVWTDERIATAQADIIEHVVNGRTIREICAMPDMPSVSTLFGWLDVHPEFAKQYARAREVAADMFEARVIEISEAAAAGSIEAAGARAAIDGFKWLAGKRKPKVYGERADPNVAVSVNVTPGYVIDLSGTAPDGPPVLDGTADRPALPPPERSDPQDVV